MTTSRSAGCAWRTRPPATRWQPLLTGHEVVVDGAYMSGADGSVPGLANVDPEGYVRQWQAYERRDWEAVRTEQDRLAELMRIVQVKGVQGFGAGVGAFKAALHLLGVFDSPGDAAPGCRHRGRQHGACRVRAARGRPALLIRRRGRGSSVPHIARLRARAPASSIFLYP